MTTADNSKQRKQKQKQKGLMSNVISGLATGLFSIPEGMAYAQLAGGSPAVAS